MTIYDPFLPFALYLRTHFPKISSRKMLPFICEKGKKLHEEDTLSHIAPLKGSVLIATEAAQCAVWAHPECDLQGFTHSQKRDFSALHFRNGCHP